MNYNPLFEKKKIRCAGLMTGTSMDGLDICVADIHLTEKHLDYQIIAEGEKPFPHELKNRIRTALTGSTPQLCELHYDLGRFYAESLADFIQKENLENLELVGSHGQTMHHVSAHSTLQIGEVSFIAEKLGIPVISDFRAMDIASGGTGAPLIPAIDRWLFGQKHDGIILLNIGGVANVSILPPLESSMPLLGFDTGPGMALLDESALRLLQQPYDVDGKMALQGNSNKALVKAWLEDPYIQQKAPKSTGRDYFGLSWLAEHQKELESLSPADQLASLADFTAQAIAVNVRPYLNDYKLKNLYVSGGGAHHPLIFSRLQEELSPLLVQPTSKLGVNVNSKEALGFAILAVAFVKVIPGNVPSVTGAKHPAVLGKFTPAS